MAAFVSRFPLAATAGAAWIDTVPIEVSASTAVRPKERILAIVFLSMPYLFLWWRPRGWEVCREPGSHSLVRQCSSRVAGPAPPAAGPGSRVTPRQPCETAPAGRVVNVNNCGRTSGYKMFAGVGGGPRSFRSCCQKVARSFQNLQEAQIARPAPALSRSWPAHADPRPRGDTRSRSRASGTPDARE